MKRNPLFILLLVLLGASLLLSACGGAGPAAPEEPTVSESEGVEAEETEVKVTEEVVTEPADPKIITISFLREWDSQTPYILRTTTPESRNRYGIAILGFLMKMISLYLFCSPKCHHLKMEVCRRMARQSR